MYCIFCWTFEIKMTLYKRQPCKGEWRNIFCCSSYRREINFTVIHVYGRRTWRRLTTWKEGTKYNTGRAVSLKIVIHPCESTVNLNETQCHMCLCVLNFRSLDNNDSYLRPMIRSHESICFIGTLKSLSHLDIIKKKILSKVMVQEINMEAV